MSLHKIKNGTPTSEVLKVIKRDGGVIIENFLNESQTERMRSELTQMLEFTRDGDDAYFSGSKTRRLGNIFSRVDGMQDIALHPLYLELARSILQTPISYWSGEHRREISPDIQVGLAQAIQIRPGQTAQPLHRDDTLWLWRHPGYGREARLQIMFAVTDFTKQNGATNVIAGSHLWDDEKKPELKNAVSAEMRAGDALIWVGSLYHGGGENTCTTERIGLTMAYDLAFLRQEENAYLTISTEKLKKLPRELQELLGWKMSSTLLGHVEINGQMTHPIELLNS